MEFTLNASIRDGIGKQKVIKLRQNEVIPAVLYGEGKPTQSIQLSTYDLGRILFKGALGKLISLSVSDGKTTQVEHVLIKELQRHPVKGSFTHIDFLRVAMDHLVTVKVPIHIVNEEKRTKDGAVIEVLMHEVEVSCLPGNIPDRINVDVQKLAMGTGIHINDLKVPEGVKVLDTAVEMVVLASAPGGAAETTTEGTEPEVVGVKKEEV